MGPEAKRATTSFAPHANENNNAKLPMDEHHTFADILQDFLNFVKDYVQSGLRNGKMMGSKIRC